MIPDAKRRFNAAEHLIHTTKKNHACFDFDIRFPKMPSYLRRAAIQHALGTVYRPMKARMEQWEETDGRTLRETEVCTCENHAMPVFYRDVMYREGTEGKDEAYLKLYDGHDWRWFRVCLEPYGYGIPAQELVMGKRHLPRHWKRDTINISCVFPIQKK
ncbi:MAG: hypothetical protein ACLVA3_03205 [Blautia wexlerae]